MTAWLASAFLLVLLLKVFLAWQLDLYSDEIFYWLASTRPAWAYSDLPFMAALFAGAGTALFGHSPLAVRVLFIVVGTALPFLVFWLARPLVPRRQALEAALLSLCLPLAAFLGTLAVPDAPLVFFGLLTIGFFERATRQDRPWYWIVLGIIAALGMSTHYRYVIYPLAAFLFLCVVPGQRRQLRNPWLWVAVAIMCVGLIPVVVFNLSANLSGLEYHFSDRHPWTFQAEGLLHPFKQALLVTPPLYIALLLTLLHLVRRGIQGDDRSALFAGFALLHIGIFLLLAPWTDNTRTSIHWPLSGYLPLIVFLPQTLRRLRDRFSSGDGQYTRAMWLIPALGFTGSLLAFAGVGSQAFQVQLQPIVGAGVLSTKMAGWSELADHLRGMPPEKSGTLLVSDNYYTAAQLEFAFPGHFNAFTIDTDKAVRDGRAAQYQLWQKDSAGLLMHQGEDALFVTEDSTLSLPEKLAVMKRACALFDNLEFTNQLVLFNGDKAYSFYKGDSVGGTTEGNGCPLPSQAWFDLPAEDSVVSGIMTVSGWAFNDGPGINRITLLLDGEPVIDLDRTLDRPDVQDIFDTADPAGIRLGFSAELDTRAFPDGKVSLALQTLSAAGELQTFRKIMIEIRNDQGVPDMASLQ